MAADPGPTFVRYALSPLRRAGAELHAGRVAEALAELPRAQLLAAFARGITATARRSGKRFEDVKRLMPGSEIDALLDEVDRAHMAATEAWRTHAGGLGGLLSGVADVTADAETDIGGALSRLAAKVVRDKHFSGPLDELALDLTRWEELARRCGSTLDADRSLHRGYFLKRLKVVVLALLVVAGAAAGLFAWLRTKAQRARIQAALGSPDPCTALADADLERALPDERLRYDERLGACRRTRDRARYEARCDALATAMEAGAVDGELMAFAASTAPIVERIARSALDARDLRETPELPCGDAPSGPRYWQAYAKAAAASATAWAVADGVSDRLKGLLRDGHPLTEASRTALTEHAESVAKKGVIGGNAANLSEGKRLCDLQEAIGVEIGRWCKGLTAALARKRSL